jgi:hypothetical protein
MITLFYVGKDYEVHEQGEVTVPLLCMLSYLLFKRALPAAGQQAGRRYCTVKIANYSLTA